MTQGDLILDEQAEERTLQRALAECRHELRVLRDQAVEASEVKLEFLASLGAAVRTPLQGLFETAELLLETPLSAPQRQYAETARRCGRRVLEIMTDVLELSALVTGRLVLADEDLDVRRLTAEVVDGVRAAAAARGIDLRHEIAVEVPRRLCGDARRLRQVLATLVANAVRFTVRGGVAARADVVASSAASVTVRFAVVDTGVGIPPERLGRVFHDPARRAGARLQGDGATLRDDGSGSRPAVGPGLGLAVARRLVEAMGGEIGVESTPALGSSFWFAVPFGVGVAARHT